MKYQMRSILSALAILLCLVASPVAATQQSVLAQPSALDLHLLAYHIAGAEPPLSALAALDPKVRAADEFKRASVAEEVERQLQSRVQSLEGVKRLKVNLSANLGEFDAKYNEYDFVGLGDGTYIPSQSPFGREVRLALTNGSEAQAWKLEPKEAEAVLQRNRGSRYVTLVMTLEILTAQAPIDGQPLVIDTKVVEYDVLGSDESVRLGKVALSGE